MLVFLNILFLHEYWVLAESRIFLKLVVGGVRIVAFSIKSHNQAQPNVGCCFHILYVLSISEGSEFYPDYSFEVDGRS